MSKHLHPTSLTYVVERTSAHSVVNEFEKSPAYHICTGFYLELTRASPLGFETSEFETRPELSPRLEVVIPEPPPTVPAMQPCAYHPCLDP